MLLSSAAAKADWPDVQIDLLTCQPKGIVAGAEASFRPKDFWVKQYGRLQTALEDTSDPGQNSIAYCSAKYLGGAGDRVAYHNCVGFYSNRRAAMARCLSFSRTLCREAGGFC